MEIDNINLKYDPRIGFIRKLGTSAEDEDDVTIGEYECAASFLTLSDRMKVQTETPKG